MSISVKTSRSGRQRDAGAGLFEAGGFLFEATNILALLKVEIILKAVPINLHIHIFRGILGSAGAQAIEAQGKLIASIPLAVIFTAGVQFTEHQLPVIPLFLGVIIHGTAPAKVLHLHRMVLEPGDDDLSSIALASLVDGVGKGSQTPNAGSPPDRRNQK